MLPTSCQANLKKLICANVYRKCVPDVVIGNSATYSTSIYNGSSINGGVVPLPFQRPCQSMCTALYCDAIPAILGMMPNCSALYDYGNFGTQSQMQYDVGNDDTVCTTIDVPVVVGESKEPYLQAGNPNGACFNIVSEIYIPNPPPAEIGLPPMLPPYVLQSAIEGQLGPAMQQFPIFLRPDCHLDLKKYLCGSNFLKPDTMNFDTVLAKNLIPSSMVISALAAQGLDATAFLANNFSLPSMPQRDVCTSFSDTCGEFIEAANNPMLTPTCDATLTNSTVMKFPWGEQTLDEFVFSGMTLQLNTSANYMSGATSDYEPNCPPGFAVAEDPHDPRVVMVQFTACAFNCITPLFTKSEWHRMDDMAAVIATLSLVALIAFFVAFSVKNKKPDEHVFLLLFAVFAFMETLWDLVMQGTPQEERFCASIHIPRDGTDGMSVCKVSSVLTIFCQLGMNIAMMFHFANICWIQVFGKPKIESTILYAQTGFVFFYPFLMTVISLADGIDGYRRNTNTCRYNSNSYDIGDEDKDVFHHPMVIFCQLTMLSILLISGKNIMIMINDNSKNTFPNFLPHLLFGMVLYFNFFVPSLLRYMRDDLSEDYLEHFMDWVECLLTGWNGSKTDMIASCGDHSLERPSIHSVLAITSIQGSNGMFVGIYAGVVLFMCADNKVHPYNEDAEKAQSDKATELKPMVKPGADNMTATLVTMEQPVDKDTTSLDKHSDDVVAF